MKKVILLFLVLGVSQVSAEKLIKECTVTVPYQCVKILDSSFDIASYNENENEVVSLTVEIKCLANSEDNPLSIMAPKEYKVFLAVQTFPVKEYLQHLESYGVNVYQSGLKNEVGPVLSSPGRQNSREGGNPEKPQNSKRIGIFNFVPSDLTPERISFNKPAAIMYVERASLTCN